MRTLCASGITTMRQNNLKNIILGFFLTMCVSSFGQDSPDYKTYSTILEEFLKHDGGDKQFIIIQRESDTTFFGGDSSTPRLMAKLDSLMKKQVMFDNRFKIKGWESTVITEKEFTDLTIDENDDLIWDPLYKRYPKAEGVIFLSPIHYTNKERTKGIMQIGIMRDNLSGGYFLVKFDLAKRRKRVTRTMTLVS